MGDVGSAYSIASMGLSAIARIADGKSPFPEYEKLLSKEGEDGSSSATAPELQST